MDEKQNFIIIFAESISSLPPACVKIFKLFKGNFIDIILASDFTQSGEISNKDINIEIIPQINNYNEIGEILEKNFE